MMHFLESYEHKCYISTCALNMNYAILNNVVYINNIRIIF